MNARSIKAASIEELKSFVQSTMDEGIKPTLAICFFSMFDKREEACNFLGSKGIEVFGASSTGEFVGDEHEETSLSMMLLDLNREYFKLVMKEFDQENTKDVAHEIGLIGKEAFDSPAFIISSSNTTIMANEIINGMTDAAGIEATIIGGNAAYKELAHGNHVFDQKTYSHSGIIALILDEDKIVIQGEAIGGWKPIGTVRTVTKSVGNWVYTLDDKPALDILLKFMGADIEEEFSDDLFYKVGNLHPLQVIQDDGTVVMRTPMLFDVKERAIIFAGAVLQDAKVRFSMPPDFDVGDKVVKSAESVRDTVMPEAEALIIFSCVGRLSCLGPMITNEIEGLQSTWDVPMIGFFTFGEYGRIRNGETMYHNTTVSWVALKEKS